MSEPERTTPPLEERILTALYTGVGVAFLSLAVWRQLDPEGPQEAWASLRDRAREWMAARRAMFEQLDEIRDLPEREREPELDVDEGRGSSS